MITATRLEKPQSASKKVAVSPLPGSSSKRSFKKSPQAPLFKGARGPGLRFDFGAIKKWVALEERIVHEHQYPAANAVKPQVSDFRRPFPAERSGSPWGKVLVLIPWLAAIIFLALHFRPAAVQKMPASSESQVSQKKNRVRGEGGALSPSVSAEESQKMKDIIANQQETLTRLKRENQDMRQTLRTAQRREKEFRAREADYRGEVYQMSLQYQQELVSLKQVNQIMEAQIQDLQSGLQAAQNGLQNNNEVLLPEVVAPAVAKKDALRGKVIMVNGRYEFVIIDRGSEKGVRVGQTVFFLQNGKEFASGSVEKVYPTLAGVAVSGEEILSQIREGTEVAVNL